MLIQTQTGNKLTVTQRWSPEHGVIGQVLKYYTLVTVWRPIVDGLIDRAKLSCYRNSIIIFLLLLILAIHAISSGMYRVNQLNGTDFAGLSVRPE